MSRTAKWGKMWRAPLAGRTSGRSHWSKCKGDQTAVAPQCKFICQFQPKRVILSRLWIDCCQQETPQAFKLAPRDLLNRGSLSSFSLSLSLLLQHNLTSLIDPHQHSMGKTYPSTASAEGRPARIARPEYFGAHMNPAEVRDLPIKHPFTASDALTGEDLPRLCRSSAVQAIL